MVTKETHFDLSKTRTNFIDEIKRKRNLNLRKTTVQKNTPKDIEEILTQQKEKQSSKNSEDMCERRINPLNPNYYYWAPVYKAKLFKVGDINDFKTNCFLKSKAEMTEITDERIVITLNLSEKESLLCSDIFIIHTPGINQLYTAFTSGEHKIIIENPTKDDLDEIRVNGLKIMGFCQGIIESLQSLYMTLLLYVGGLGYDVDDPDPLFRPTVPQYMIDNNIAMVKFYNNYRLT